MKYRDFVLPHDLKLPDREQSTVLHFNARSAESKDDDIGYFLKQFSFHFNVIMITETWYSNDSNIMHLDGFRHFFLNRQCRRGGGVSVLVERRGNYDLVSEFCKIEDDYEILTIRDNLDVLSVVYRPPNGNILRFLEFFEYFLEYVSANKYRLVCGGDFNINVLDRNPSVCYFTNRLFSAGFVNLINTPTRVTQTTSSCLDLLITNVDTFVLEAGTISSDVSDHCPVFMSYTVSKTRHYRDEPLTTQRITEYSLESFKQDISAYDWSYLFDITDATTAYSKFIAAFVEIYTANFPFRKIQRSKRIKKTMGNSLNAYFDTKQKQAFSYLLAHSIARRSLEVQKNYKQIKC